MLSGAGARQRVRSWTHWPFTSTAKPSLAGGHDDDDDDGWEPVCCRFAIWLGLGSGIGSNTASGTKDLIYGPRKTSLADSAVISRNLSLAGGSLDDLFLFSRAVCKFSCTCVAGASFCAQRFDDVSLAGSFAHCCFAIGLGSRGYGFDICINLYSRIPSPSDPVITLPSPSRCLGNTQFFFRVTQQHSSVIFRKA